MYAESAKNCFLVIFFWADAVVSVKKNRTRSSSVFWNLGFNLTGLIEAKFLVCSEHIPILERNVRVILKAVVNFNHLLVACVGWKKNFGAIQFLHIALLNYSKKVLRFLIDLLCSFFVFF
jgi:hypothetical protein